MLLLLGASGYVGSAFAHCFTSRGIEFLPVTRADCNYYEPGVLRRKIRETKATFLINCAGFTGKPNVDACELAKSETLLGNSVLPGLIARECAAVDLPWGHVSSGCIFSGRNPDGSGFSEEDIPNFSFRDGPCSFYSGTKALGEEALGCVESLDKSGRPYWDFSAGVALYIWRLRIPFNHVGGPRNYLTKLQRYDQLLEAENSISRLEDFVQACYGCWEKQVPFGVYNVTNPGSVTTRQVVAMIQEAAQKQPECGLKGQGYDFFADESDFMRRAAQTPRSNCVMDSSKLSSVGIEIAPVEVAIRESLAKWATDLSPATSS